MIPASFTWKEFGIEIAKIAIVAIAVSYLFSELIYPQLNLGENLPMPARTLSIWIMITWLIRQKGTRWSDFGLSKPKKAWRVVLVALGLIVFELILAEPINAVLFRIFNVTAPNYQSFGFIQGNVTALIYFLILSWAIGGFVEEMIFRGYLMPRIQKLINHRMAGIILSILLQGIIFGLFHLYQGWGGVIATGMNGIAFGIAYQASGRNLWAGIMIHALMDCAGIILIYLNGIPNL